MARFDGPRPVAGIVGLGLLLVAAVSAGLVATMPAPYVIQRPGPVFDVLGDVEVEGQDVPLISIPLEPTFATQGALRMLTVTVAGSREHPANWLEVIAAQFDPAVAVVPVDQLFPVGTTREEDREAARFEMENSQREAIAAAMHALGSELHGTVTVEGVVDGAPAEGILLEGDIVLSVNGTTFADASGLRAAIAESGAGASAEIALIRDGAEQTVVVEPERGDDGAPVIGVYVSTEYEFPFTVKIQLENVGGPSAGMMFALGIYDKLTPGALTGGEDVSGTGTISGSGVVGPIGGIRQKMHGAVQAGADWFLAPAANCDEVVGHVPDGLQVFAVESLDDALDALAGIRAGVTTSLTTCEGLLVAAK